MEDKTFDCIDCGKSFVWTVSEQKFYQQKGFESAPKRCVECRRLKKQMRESRGGE